MSMKIDIHMAVRVDRTSGIRLRQKRLINQIGFLAFVVRRLMIMFPLHLPVFIALL